MERSTNCSAYTDTISILVDASASIAGDDKERCTVPLPPTFSCQTSAFEAPDDVTRAQLEARASQLLQDKGCDVSRGIELDFATNLVGSQHMEYSAEKLSSLGMASNCFREGNDINHATHIIRAECSNQYDMTDDFGRRVRDTNKKFLSNLSTCDVSDAAMPQLLEDARKVAAYHAGENGYKADRDTDLSCTFSILPQL